MQTPNPELTITPLSLINTFITAYGPKLKVALTCAPGFGRTKQSFKDDTDINNILARFIQTGTLDFANKNQPQYGEIAVADFQSAMNIVASANSMFAELPAALRNRFKNDPSEFLAFVQDERNTEEAIELGLGTAQVAPVQPAEPGATPPVAVAAEAPTGRRAGREALQRSRRQRYEEDDRNDDDTPKA